MGQNNAKEAKQLGLDTCKKIVYQLSSIRRGGLPWPHCASVVVPANPQPNILAGLFGGELKVEEMQSESVQTV